MAVPTRSSNPAATAALAAGLLAVAALPAAIALAQLSARFKLTQAAVGAPVAALLFGFASAVAPRLELVSGWANYGTLFQILPYVLTLIAVAGVIGRSIPPAAVGRPYAKQ